MEATVTADNETEPDAPKEGLHLNNLPDGSYLLNGTLGEDSGNTISEAIRVATTTDVEGEPERTPAQRRADALADICQFFLDHQAQAGPVANRSGLVVVADLEVLERRSPGIATRLDGRPLKRAALERIACDADIHRIITDGRGRILDFGRRTRLISDALRLAVSVLDQGCRFPDCGRPISLCQVHHVVQWTDEGPTEPSNLASTCLRHHQILHQPGWHAKLLPDRTFEVTMPTGRVLIGHPPSRIVSPPRE